MVNAAAQIAEGLKQAISEKGRATLVVSGGSSPVATFQALSQMDLEWEKITITLVDDRDVSLDHKDSNTLLVREHLLQNKAAKAQYLPLTTSYEQVEALPRPFDIMLLGMGPDGHFASLFPDMVGEKHSFDLSAAPEIFKTEVKGNPAHPRITMNLAMILQTNNLFLLVAGEQKKKVLMQAKTDTALPIHYLLKQNIKEITIIKD